ncbi:hypothetical protein RIF25_04875 [Thermosynechococcaceae cyanobacterium BACA0444]|uniref:Uncharacterized protein n=1 Tax=Pseudocalidococcus azoricus BACA0444 TaxID=2918990 RepID=A0AAE4FQ07_9CYAN|nr:hypothetical protein [Pseudocalidococcus azoricus]MDS3860134.1 hypothetical protein [Pseudocalidococcus azoricus BACA0444]
MKLNLTDSEQKRLAAANIQAAFEFRDLLKQHGGNIPGVPASAVVLPMTEDAWINEQNQKLAKKAESEGKTVYWLQLTTPLKTPVLS